MSKPMKVAALGQPFTLGMLYDARRDELIPGSTLWDRASLDENTREVYQTNSFFEISASDTIEDKSSLMDIQASLKTSFLAGLVEVGGSAKYLNDQKKFKNQCRVTFRYKATTVFKELSLHPLGPLNNQQKQVIEEGRATHVVTGILYGANAVFVFDSEKMDVSKVQDIQGNMQAVLKKIPLLDIKGNAQMKLTEEEKELTNKFTCKFFGDLILKKNPATFVQAVETYCELPTLLADKENNAPLVVWLYPLQALHNKAAVLVSGLSASLSRKIQEAMEDENQVQMRCNDSLFSEAAQTFPDLRKNVSSFQKLCSSYYASLKLALCNKLPSIRDGKENESALTKVFDDGENSPFRTAHLNEWLENKERDINVIQSCVTTILEDTNICVVRTKSELDQVVLSQRVTDVLCYVFTDLDTNDPCLDAMAKYLDTSQPGGTHEEYKSFTDEVIIKMRKNVQMFLNCAKIMKSYSSVKFLIAAQPNKDYKGSSIYHYKDGFLRTDNFPQPAVPSSLKEITERKDLIWYATDLTLDENTVHENLTLSKENKKVTFDGVNLYPDNSKRFTESPQVLCKEPLTGCHYWEVEFEGSISVVVAYSVNFRRHVCRRFINFRNSWGILAGNSTLFKVENQHARELSWRGCAQGVQKLGVYLDYTEGTLSFFGVSGEQLKHYHTTSCLFERQVYAGFGVYGEGSSAYLSI